MTVEAKKETHSFQAEVKQVLSLVINSLYSNKEIFLRELISNASDAADKLRFTALSDSSLYEDDPELKVWLTFDKDKRTVTIRDNGIGMTAEEMKQNLGTIAKSGTKEFLKNLTGDKAKDSQLIGQFGVGFYSAFIVAESVTVYSRKAGESQGHLWSSKGDGEFELAPADDVKRGTEIILHLKPDEDEFLNNWKLRHIVTKYSDHITLPVMMEKEQAVQEEDKDKPEAEADENKAPELEAVNRATALWTLPKSEIKEEQYKELYKHVAHDFEDPLTWTHNKVEGKLEYTSLIYVPQRAPFDLWHAAKPKGLKLYVQRVFIMDDADQFLPNYLRFVRGIIDSNDLPLNVSREILQSSKITDTIRQAVTKRTLTTLESLAKDDKEKYQKFWKEFGQVLKEGPAEDFANKELVAKLLRFSSTHTDKADQDVSLQDYVARMQEKQDKIYYVVADTFNAAKNSPHLEIFRDKGIEVLILSDRVDEWLMAHLTEFDGKQLQSVARGALDLGDLGKTDEADKKEAEGDYADCIKQMKEILGDKVKDIRVSARLNKSPACIVTDVNDMSLQMQKIMQAAGQQVPDSKPILEINPKHLLVQKLKDTQADDRFSDWTQILFDQAILAEGGQLDDPASFVSRFNSLLLEMSN